MDFVYEAVELLNRHSVIGVHEQDKIATRFQAPTPDCSALTKILGLSQNAQVRPIGSGLRLSQFRGSVTTAIVHDHDFLVAEVIVEVWPYLPQCPRQAVRLVEGRNDHRQRFGSPRWPR